MKIYHLKTKGNSKSCNNIVIEIGDTKYFFSYETLICKIKKNKVYLDEYYWNYSRTTGFYRNQFLNESISETKEKIKKGIYTLTNLQTEYGECY